jgi:glycosyltransferase involved in cell wall biosynthesis
MGMAMVPDISVIIPTYNRSQDLARTLEGMVRTEKGNLSVEFIVVDNGSTDQTKLVVDSFSDRIAIQYIFEARSGKNCALNSALEKCKLGKIVVFTDDDVDVSPDWLVSIRAVCDRWPNHAVFGGRIDVIFPIGDIPEWASDPHIRNIAFAYHNYSEKETLYGGNQTPVGPNYWVRKHVLDNGRRFDEAIGPRPMNRIMGSETSFLRVLLKDNYEIVYSPRVVVGHRIQPESLKISDICLRAYRFGRSGPHVNGLPQHTLLKHHPAAWRLYRCGAITWNISKVLFSTIFSSNGRRLANCTQGIASVGYQIESMRLAKKIRGEVQLRNDFNEDLR